ncbi:hypothetical protein BKA70DRAFT_56546 [Coprinopsis sp. MPI-PUGE-AT-0042]|nr:hypothetical protein BKA70DRAFT_56546 [Coprinopsis sp. MPI-PUGE-AT-0042]
MGPLCDEVALRGRAQARCCVMPRLHTSSSLEDWFAAEILVNVCCGLLVIEEETQQVRLIHYTAKAVLKALLVKVVPYPHSLLAAICMNRLSEGGFQRSSINSKSDFDAALKASPLLPYAYHAWSEHVQASLDDVTAQSRVSSFLRGCHSFPIMRRIYGIFRSIWASPRRRLFRSSALTGRLGLSSKHQHSNQ